MLGREVAGIARAAQFRQVTAVRIQTPHGAIDFICRIQGGAIRGQAAAIDNRLANVGTCINLIGRTTAGSGCRQNLGIGDGPGIGVDPIHLVADQRQLLRIEGRMQYRGCTAGDWHAEYILGTVCRAAGDIEGRAIGRELGRVRKVGVIQQHRRQVGIGVGRNRGENNHLIRAVDHHIGRAGIKARAGDIDLPRSIGDPQRVLAVLIRIIGDGIGDAVDAGVGRDGEDEDSVLGDFIEDEDGTTPEESATSQLLKEQVQSILSTLSDREQKIVKMRFGLENGKSHTLEEVGQEFAVTRERIRQIEAKALAKLRKHKDAKKLHEYLG